MLQPNKAQGKRLTPLDDLMLLVKKKKAVLLWNGMRMAAAWVASMCGTTVHKYLKNGMWEYIPKREWDKVPPEHQSKFYMPNNSNLLESVHITNQHFTSPANSWISYTNTQTDNRT